MLVKDEDEVVLVEIEDGMIVVGCVLVGL